VPSLTTAALWKSEGATDQRNWKVARKLGRQFSTAIDLINDAIPDAIKLEGHDPLTLLHDALSDGLHSQDDAECLRIAGDVRHD
jgi:hypothetical protein